jgi:hypothetical protein
MIMAHSRWMITEIWFINSYLCIFTYLDSNTGLYSTPLPMALGGSGSMWIFMKKKKDLEKP